ncbi:MAG: hypothetical protein AAFN11_12575 [Chloroflexota bacterium]
MPEQNDFLQALKENMPADFAKDLRDQLRAIEQEDKQPKQLSSRPRSSSW